MSSVQNQTILITGAASGLGRMMAERFAARGAHLVLWDRDAVGLAETQAALAAHPIQVHTDVVDLTDRAAIYATAERVNEAVGGVDILINNAGIISGKPLLDLSDEAIERTFAVNTLALFWTTRAFLPGMLVRGHGHIVTVASAAGLAGTARQTDYAASKFAAVGFDESLRLEFKRLGQPIHTTVICPFYIDTGMFDGVKTRLPWLLPILTPDYAVDRMVDAVVRRRRRLIMPRFIRAVFPTRLLPVDAFDALMHFLGITRSMDEFKGRTKVEH